MVPAERAAQVAPAVRAVRVVPAEAGGGTVLGTLADAYANPIMVDALIIGREGTISPRRHRLLRSAFAGHHR